MAPAAERQCPNDYLEHVKGIGAQCAMLFAELEITHME